MVLAMWSPASRRLVQLGLVLLVASLSVASASSDTALPDPLELRALLTGGDLDALESRLDGWRRAGQGRALTAGLRAFQRLGPQQTAALEHWVAARPDAALARLALAWREVGLAWQARGLGFASGVTPDGRSRAEARAHRALLLAEEALARDPGLVDAHALRIEAARLTGDAALQKRAFEAGLAVDPAHEELWRQWMWSRTRRWGGSYEELERIAREAQRYANANPRLAELRALPDADRASDLANAGRWKEALEAYDRALSRGELAWVYASRGTAHERLGHTEAALADVDRSLELDPYSADAHSRRAGALVRMERYDEALRSLEQAMQLDPTRPTYASDRRDLAAWIHRHERWEAFKRQPTLKQAVLYAVGWLYAQSVEALGVALAGVLAWGGWRAWHRRRSRVERDGAEPAPSGAEVTLPEPLVGATARDVSLSWPVLLLIRAAVWPVALVHVYTYVGRWEGLQPVARWVDVPVTAIAFVGAFAFSLQRPLGAPVLWKVWAWLFPLWNVLYHFAIQGASLAQWPLWSFTHFSLLPVYASLSLYGYRSRALWRRDSRPAAHARRASPCS